jgi:hypothetical protein
MDKQSGNGLNDSREIPTIKKEREKKVRRNADKPDEACLPLEAFWKTAAPSVLGAVG